MNFKIEIPNIAELTAAFARYPSVSLPILTSAIAQCNALLVKYTVPGIVPVRSGYLVQNWSWYAAGLVGIWKPIAGYAYWVESGTKPHVIQSKGPWPLRNAKTGQVFGTKVNHPGTQPNPFIERIIDAAQADINQLFVQALDNIIAAIGTQPA